MRPSTSNTYSSTWRRKNAWLFRVVALAFLAIFSRVSFGADAPELGLTANQKMLWISCRQAEPNGTLLLYFASRRLDVDRKTEFVPLFRWGRTGAVARAIAIGDALEVFYRDGTHRQFASSHSRWDTWAPPLETSERNLPRDAVPTAITADHGLGVMYAAVSAKLAREIMAREREARAKDEENENSQTVGDGQDPTATLPSISSDVVIVRYESQSWHIDREGPGELTSHTAVQALLVHDGTVHIIYASEEGSPVWVHQVSESAPSTWSNSLTIPFESTPTAITSSMVEGSPVIAVALRQQEGIGVRAMTLQENQWIAAPLLQHESGTVHFAQPLALALSGTTLAVATLDQGRNVDLGRWSWSTGDCIEPPSAVRSISPQAPQLISRTTRHLIEYAVLIAILVSLFLWRRGSVLLVAPLATGQTFAPLLRRLAAVMIDLLILSPVWMLALYALWNAEGLTLTELNLRVRSPDADLGIMSFFFPAVGFILGVYATIFEFVTTSTPGKRAVGIQVLGQDGKASSFGAIFWRNAMRVVEFEFVPLVLLMALTPSRQRLGDIVARTIVVTTGPPVARIPQELAAPDAGGADLSSPSDDESEDTSDKPDA